MNIRKLIKYIKNIFQLNQKLDFLIKQVEINNEINKIIIDHFKINTTINAYEKRIISQNGEDGITEEIFHRIGTTNNYFVEFGVEDGLQCNTGYLAAFKDWSGLMIEGNKKMFKQLVKNYSHLPKIKITHQHITKDNINAIFKDMNVPNEFDLLSIDIDGNDYWVWKALQDYKPRVVIIEYNATYAPSQRWIMDYDPHFLWNGTSYFGASLMSLYELGKQLGYTLIGTDSSGTNAFFMRQDQVDISGFEQLDPESAYHPPRYGHFFGGHPKN